MTKPVLSPKVFIRFISVCLILVALFPPSQVYAQEKPAIDPPAEGKAVVYFVRSSSLGVLINFTYFDSATVISRSKGTNYVRYECEPGRHLFWARSENRDFLEATLEAGKIYFIDVSPQMGAMKASVRLNAVNPGDDAKVMKKIFKLLNKKKPETFTAEELAKEQEQFQEVIQRGLEKYQEEKAKEKKMEQLPADWYYTGS